jgi:hypothetical protein
MCDDRKLFFALATLALFTLTNTHHTRTPHTEAPRIAARRHLVYTRADTLCSACACGARMRPLFARLREAQRSRNLVGKVRNANR